MRKIESNPNLIVPKDTSIRDALKKIDANSEGILFVVDTENKLVGALTDGDIRRSLLAGKALTESIKGSYNETPFSFQQDNFNLEDAKRTIVEKRFEVVPFVDSMGHVVGYLSWEDLVTDIDRREPGRIIDVPVVIMAGGKGTRMAPFTNVLPKPLIPIGNKTILEMIFDSFRRFQVSDFFLTINYRGEMIRAYLDCIDKDYSVTYIKEEEFRGTAGSLALLPSTISQTFIVSNCDIIVSADYSDVLEYHRKSKAKLTILSSIQHHQVPYGVIKFEAGGRVLEIEEKPELSFCINTGVYVLEKECLDFIPPKNVFHMTDLIEMLMRKGEKVSTYPVNERDYIDVGQWEDYRKAVGLIGGN